MVAQAVSAADERLVSIKGFGKLVGLLILLVALAACSAATPAAPTFTPAPTASPVPTLTPTPPSPGVLAFTDTPVLPTPSLPMHSGKDFYLGDLLFASEPDCALPCWSGLMVGQSKPEDVQRMFDTVFGFKGKIDLFSDDYVTYLRWTIIGVKDDLPNLFSTGYSWTTDKSRTGNFYVLSGFDRNTSELQVLGVGWDTTDTSVFDIHLSPQQVIRELGQPSQIFALVHTGETTVRAFVELLLLYDNGIGFHFFREVEGDAQLTDNNRVRVTAEYCLSNNQPRLGDSGTGGYLYIIPPLEHGLDDLTPLQTAIVQKGIERGNLRPVEEVFSATIQEIVQLALEDSEACLTAVVP